jgi:hypothetical protein
MPEGCDYEFEAHKHIENKKTGEAEQCPFRCILCRCRIPGSNGFGPPCQCKRGEESAVTRLACAWLISDEPAKFSACINSAMESVEVTKLKTVE